MKVDISEEMTISRFGRGTCSVCGRSIRLLRDGTIGPHGNKVRDLANPYWGQNCRGWKQKPKGG